MVLSLLDIAAIVSTCIVNSSLFSDGDLNKSKADKNIRS